jgi:hypothetical protein
MNPNGLSRFLLLRFGSFQCYQCVFIVNQGLQAFLQPSTQPLAKADNRTFPTGTATGAI